jgi:uncharacterized coiled-coil DUF342 family protein
MNDLNKLCCATLDLMRYSQGIIEKPPTKTIEVYNKILDFEAVIVEKTTKIANDQDSIKEEMTKLRADFDKFKKEIKTEISTGLTAMKNDINQTLVQILLKL